MFKLFQIFIFLTLILCVITSEAYGQTAVDTSRILVRFNEPMSYDGIFDITNYQILRDDLIPVAVFKVGVVPGDTAVVLFTESYIPSSKYKIIVNNLKDKSGNPINPGNKIALY